MPHGIPSWNSGGPPRAQWWAQKNQSSPSGSDQAQGGPWAGWSGHDRFARGPGNDPPANNPPANYPPVPSASSGSTDINDLVDSYTPPAPAPSGSSISGGSVPNGGVPSGGGPSGSSGTLSSGFGMGVQINYAGGDSIAAYEQRTGTKPTSTGTYISVANGSVDTSDAEAAIADAAKNGVGTVDLSVKSGESGQLSPQEVSQFQQLAADAKAKGVTLQVRFGYEMNLPGVSGFTDPSVFKEQWNQVASAVHAGGGQMVWCPSNSNAADYQKWMPDPSTIDVVGLDVYHMGNGPIQPDEVKNALTGMEQAMTANGIGNKPLILPETGVQLAGDGSDASKVTQWLQQLSDPSLLQSIPNYQGFMWFDYNKPGDGNYALSQNAQYTAALDQWYAQALGGSTS